MKKRRVPPAKKRQRSSLKPLRFVAVSLGLLVFVGLAAFLYSLAETSPTDRLHTAINTSFSESSVSSLRFDGSLTSSDPKFTLSFSGQVKNNDHSYIIKLPNSSFGSISATGSRYYQFTNPLTFEKEFATAAGLEPMTEVERKFLTNSSGRYISSVDSLPNPYASCLDRLPLIFSTIADSERGEGYRLFDLRSAPQTVDLEGSEVLLYDAALRDERKPTKLETRLGELLACVGKLQKPDFKLRNLTTADAESVKISIYVDTYSGRVAKLRLAYVGFVAELNMRDYNKDIAIIPPGDPIAAEDIYELMTPADQAALNTKYGGN